MDWLPIASVVIIVLIIIYMIISSKRKKQPMSDYDQAIDKLVDFVKKNPDLSSYLPQYTFPIQGICKDGELVEDVLKRLELEGNQEKLLYFRRYMGLHFAGLDSVDHDDPAQHLHTP